MKNALGNVSYNIFHMSDSPQSTSPMLYVHHLQQHKYEQIHFTGRDKDKTVGKGTFRVSVLPLLAVNPVEDAVLRHSVQEYLRDISPVPDLCSEVGMSKQVANTHHLIL